MNQRLPYAPVLLTLLAGLCLATGAAVAAPATSEELNAAATAPSGGAAAPSTPLVVGSSVSQSKTVELLLQLQDQPPQDKPSADSPRRSVALPAKTAAAPAVDDPNPLLALKETLLGSATPRDSSPDTRRAETADAATPHGTMAARFPSTATAGGDAEPRQSLLSNPVVRFLREHRGLILTASLGVLAALWFTASFSIRRGR